MKIRLSQLRRIISEEVRKSLAEGLAAAALEMTPSEAEAFIASKDLGEIVEQDIIDSETGEIYVEAGKTYSDAYIHPQHSRKTPASNAGIYADDDDDEIMSDISRSKDVHAEFTAALEEFASNYEGFSKDVSDVDPQDAASDIGLNFFHSYPQWKEWARVLDLTKADIQSAAAEYAYEAMLK